MFGNQQAPVESEEDFASAVVVGFAARVDLDVRRQFKWFEEVALTQSVTDVTTSASDTSRSVLTIRTHPAVWRTDAAEALNREETTLRTKYSWPISTPSTCPPLISSVSDGPK